MRLELLEIPEPLELLETPVPPGRRELRAMAISLARGIVEQHT